MRVKNGPEGADKAPPPQITKARGVPVTRWQTKYADKNPEMEGTNPPRLKTHPLGITLPRGGRDHPFCPLRRERLLGPSRETCAAAKQKGENKNQTKKHRTPLPPRVQERASPKNAWGPEWHPGKNAKKQDARPKGAKTKPRRDKNKNNKTSACGSVPCDYLSFIS